jgi:hypothetical protein
MRFPCVRLTAMTSFDELMAEGLAAPFTKWDFSLSDGRC